ncbi:glycosyltransferase [Arthrobacter sp. FX8]|uniref:glycosyltransferase n=1 Tax=Arthrobacter sp. FX8 TaxID=2997335 RepID=UPI00227D6705|nr:glycosyltransferase [Arthrobacter sp. FX8]WAJ32009.1 glycosyltransferase [Arthrobacter sp. FX8]
MAALPAAEGKATVAWLGPGLVQTTSLNPRDTGNLLLIGGAAHKENEAAAEMLARIKPLWLKSVTGIGVSTEVKAIIDREFGPDFGTWMSNVSDDEVLRAYRQAEFFMLLSQDEGFGLPFVEALASGCQVIALDQPLTRELLGDACTYVSRDHASDSLILAEKPAISVEARMSVVNRFSWSNFGDAVVGKLQVDDLAQ